MSEEQLKKRNYNGIIIILIGIGLLGALVWAFINNKQKQLVVADNHNHDHNHSHDHSTMELKVENLSMEHIVSNLGSFNLTDIAPDWQGKEAPDFTLKDINGKQHKLSDYRGKDVLVTFWATWCPPCLQEIPELIGLRKKISEDELAILAISNESQVTLETFAEKRGLNYTVLRMEKMLDEPYDQVRYIPSNFFIDKNGRIKLAVTNPMSQETMEMIIKAK